MSCAAAVAAAGFMCMVSLMDDVLRAGSPCLRMVPMGNIQGSSATM